MRCKQCDYPLWALHTRECPECGTPFRPSDYEFVANSVRFCCPHCNQSYFGTGSLGHLVPREFGCVSCGRRIQMDEMVLFPAEGVQEEQTAVEQMPWLNRQKRGPVKAWFATVGMAMVRPSRLMQLTPVDSSVWQAYWFGVLSNMLFVLIGLLPFMLLPVIFAMGAGAMPVLGAGGGMLALTILGPALGLIVFALAVHGLLLLTSRSEGLGRTFQAIAYSSGANAVMAIPCLGIYLFPFALGWWVISAILMLVEGQKVRGWRASVCVLTPPVLVLAGLIVWGVMMVRWTTAAMSSAQTVTGSIETQTMVSGLLSYQQREGQWPSHAIELVTASDVKPYDVICADTGTTEDDIPVGGIHLADLDDLSKTQVTAVVQGAVGMLPGGVIAHRLGDFVFTYHGITGTPADPSLWLVVRHADPDANAPIQLPAAPVVVGRADGTTVVVPAVRLNQALARQNAVRAQHGLPPLPHPDTITHTTPAAATQTAPAPSGDGQL